MKNLMNTLEVFTTETRTGFKHLEKRMQNLENIVNELVVEKGRKNSNNR